ncbi:hypothetical protein MBLNU230_g6260t1 [Neophaeotheca triangularis]
MPDSETIPGTSTEPGNNHVANPAPKLSREAIIWLVVISVIVAIAFIAILILLTRCHRRQTKAKVPSDQDSNPDFKTPDPTFHHPLTFDYAYNSPALTTVSGKYGHYATASATQPPVPMEKVRVRADRLPDPVVVDEAEVGSVGSGRLGFREREHRETGRDKGSRFYSGWGLKRLSRVSQVGKAF